VARPIIEEVAARTEGMVTVVVHDAPHARGFVMMRTTTTGPIRYGLDPGMAVPLHAGAIGRALLSRLGTGALSAPLTSFTSNTVTDLRVLDQLIAQDRSLGYSISIAEHFDLAAGVAAPFDVAGLLGAISVTRPSFEATNQDLHRTGMLLRAAADELTRLAEARRNDTAEDAEDAVAGPDDRDKDGEAGSLVTRFERLITALSTTHGGIGVTRRSLSACLGANPATAAKLMRSALESGLALRQGDRLHPGPTLIRWAAALGVTEQKGALAYEILHDLAEQTGETIGMAELDRATTTASMATVIPGTKPVTYVFASGIPIPLAAGAAGKAILAHLPEAVLTAQELEPHTDRTPLNVEDISRDLQLIRDRGWATGEGERIPEAYGVAAPYFVDGAVAGSVTITVPRTRAGELDHQILADHVVRAAAEVTALLSIHP
jgi:DNA-binding IclR family transcriptional regulator